MSGDQDGVSGKDACATLDDVRSPTIRSRAVPLAILILAGVTTPARAQGTGASQSFWSDVDRVAAGLLPRAVMPTRYRTLRLDVPALREYLRGVPSEGAPAAPAQIVLPRPGGGEARFTALDSPVMEPPLQRQFPAIRTYRGQGLDDRSATIRFDLTTRGFHAMVLSHEGALFIDPWQPGDDQHYIAYFKHDLPGAAAFRCLSEGASQRHDAAQALPNGDTLRTYRLALAGDGEYTEKVCLPNGPATDCGLAAMVTGINRVNEVYERDLAVHLSLIANEPLIIYTDPDTDPYTDGVPATMREENQANLDAVIGTANYDIGHVFGTAGGGIAGIAGVCGNGLKGRAATGRSNPTGDPFFIDYVAHEMGHQFGANHVFNGTTSFCGQSRNDSTAWEPGSGSTILSYSGLCGDENVQDQSDDYFNIGTLGEITGFIHSASGSCSANTPTGDTLPSVSAGPDIEVPASTPFTLSATASDADGDALSYAWEEADLGDASPPNTDNGNRPIFRTYLPDVSPARTFPQLQYILNDGNSPPEQPVSESLPTTTRTLRFQATVRDNRSGGGAVVTDLMRVAVTGTAGPFRVTQPDTPITWVEGTTETVTWSVANTTAAPVSCATVDILLSTDGGNSFPISLATRTSNSGSQAILVPATATGTARVKVECATSPFFDISNTNFSISPVPVELQQLRVE
jgi:hypothetical protein